MKYLNMRPILLVTLVLICTTFASAAEKAKVESKPTTKQLMQSFLEQLTILKPYMVSDEKIVDPKNELEIAKSLKEFSRLAKLAAHDPVLNKENFKFSRSILEHHIADVERTFRLGNKHFARWQLASTASICMSCHTQMRSTDRTFENFVNHKSFSSEFDQAEFLFATRAFDKAFAMFDSQIMGYPKNGVTTDELGRALERQLTYYTRLKRDLPGGIIKMKAYLKNEKLPPFARRNIEAWVQQMESFQAQKPIDPSQSSAEQVLAFAKKNIESQSTRKMIEASNPKLVTYLYVSGMLFEYLSKYPRSASVPELLYWLSICDRSINYSLFYSLADLYLRECIVSYPASPMAKKCYKEFEEATILGYSGSAGTQVPPDVQTDLDQLRKLVESRGKIESNGPK